MGVRVDDTFKSLVQVWTLALARRCRVLALTVPETAGCFPVADARRADLNGRIKSYRAPGFHVLDLHEKIPCRSLDEPQRALYWDDGVHLTGRGYDWMGDHVADALIPLVLGDSTRLDEEGGDPKDISRGYVVVRREDLY